MKQFKTNISILAFFLVSTAAFTGCNDDNDVTDPPKPNEEELITTVELTFTNLRDTSEVNVFRFADPDGDGGNGPTQFDTIKLASKGAYSMLVRFLDESTSEIEDITEEIKEEATDHLVCFSSDGNGLFVAPQDRDKNGLKLGLFNNVMTNSPESTNLTVSLKHQPGIKNGSCDVGETDVEVAFVLEVK
jgi:hypothetical protein